MLPTLNIEQLQEFLTEKTISLGEMLYSHRDGVEHGLCKIVLFDGEKSPNFILEKIKIIKLDRERKNVVMVIRPEQFEILENLRLQIANGIGLPDYSLSGISWERSNKRLNSPPGPYYLRGRLVASSEIMYTDMFDSETGAEIPYVDWPFKFTAHVSIGRVSVWISNPCNTDTRMTLKISIPEFVMTSSQTTRPPGTKRPSILSVLYQNEMPDDFQW